MSWVKIDDSAPLHPKLFAAGIEASGLWWAGLCYANRTLSDGWIPEGGLPLVYPGSNLLRLRRLVGRLVAVHLWECKPGGWQIHDYHTYQPKASEVKRIRELRAQSGRLGGQASGEARSKHVASRVVEANANPVPVPVPVPEKKETEGPPKPPKGVFVYPPGFMSFWQVFPRQEGKGKALEEWQKAGCERQAASIVLAVTDQLPHLNRDGGRFRPLPATWLHQRRWEDAPVLIEPNGHSPRAKINDAWAGKTGGVVNLRDNPPPGVVGRGQ